MVAADNQAEIGVAEFEPSVDFLKLTNFIHSLNAPFGGVGSSRSAPSEHLLNAA